MNYDKSSKNFVSKHFLIADLSDAAQGVDLVHLLHYSLSKFILSFDISIIMNM